jgi:Cu-processing system ATP-binding protein
LIRIQGLRKSFGRLLVLRDLDLEMPDGRITALIGPNGSGKTTLIQCVLGLVRPDRGSIFVGGQELNGDDGYRASIGYMPQVAPFPDNLTAREIIEMLMDVRGRREGLDTDLITAFDLESEMEKPLRTLSGGTRQKVNALAAFLFRPPLLILDEPTAGLDPVASRALKDKILAERQAGRSFVLTSHLTSELEELSEHIAFIVDGSIRFVGQAEELRRRTGASSLDRALTALARERRTEVDSPGAEGDRP